MSKKWSKIVPLGKFSQVHKKAALYMGRPIKDQIFLSTNILELMHKNKSAEMSVWQKRDFIIFNYTPSISV